MFTISYLLLNCLCFLRSVHVLILLDELTNLMNVQYVSIGKRNNFYITCHDKISKSRLNVRSRSTEPQSANVYIAKVSSTYFPLKQVTQVQPTCQMGLRLAIEDREMVNTIHCCWVECKTDSRYSENWPKSLRKNSGIQSTIKIQFLLPITEWCSSH